jgi:hypothetical protein
LYIQDITCMLNCFEEISQNFAQTAISHNIRRHILYKWKG